MRRLLFAVAIAIAGTAAAQPITVNPAEYFAYGPMPMSRSILLISKAKCEAQGAGKEWKKARSSSGSPACWRDWNDPEPGQNLQVCFTNPDNGELTQACAEIAFSYFKKTTSLPAKAF